jgi:hypothetical protein
MLLDGAIIATNAAGTHFDISQAIAAMTRFDAQISS